LVATEPSHPKPTLIYGLLLGLALPLAGYLAISLTILGLDKYHYILAGGKRFATFPNDPSFLGISLAYLALVLLHFYWVIGSDRAYAVSKFSSALKFSSLFLLLAWVAYPLGNDVYLYLHVGLMNLTQTDPFVTPAGDFLSPLTPFVDWKQTSTYGPISQLLFMLAAIAVPFHPVLAIYGFKTICLGMHILNGYLVWKILPESQRGKWTIAYLLAPVLLMEQVASAHVDVFVSTSILLTAMCVFSRRYATAFLALWGGFMAKTIPVLWMPMLALYLFRTQRWKQLMLGLAVSAAIAILLTLSVLPSLDAWRSLLNPGVTGQFQSSIHALLRAGLETLPYFSADAPPPSVYKYWLLALSRYTLMLFVGFYLWICLRMFRRRYLATQLFADMGWVTLVLMLYATAWLMPWYVSILYAIAVVIPQARLLGLTILTFGISSSAMYLLQGDAGLRSLCAIGLPTVVLAIGAMLGVGQTADGRRPKVDSRWQEPERVIGDE
jgi:alpha-1,6-mannosyltransferase